MKTLRLIPSLLAAACLAACAVQLAAAADDTSTSIKFSDPGKPGTVKLRLGRGELTVQGADTAEITVKSDVKITSKPRSDGLRVISSASGFAYSEKDNVVTIDSAMNDFGKSSGNLRVTVPRNTNVVVESNWGGGSVKCANLSGDIEINSMHGEIRLDDVSGGVVVGTMNGEIRASLRELREGKPVSFTTMNGEVQIRLPETAKANVRLRTQNGVVLTDFEENVLVTKTETSPGLPRGRVFMGPKGSKVISAEVEEAIKEATRVSATAVQEALVAVKEGLEASKIETDEARQKVEEARREIDKARRESDRARRDAERAARNEAKPATAAPEAPPAPPAPAAMAKPAPVPKIATTISGGKLVTGTLNGGGPEISVSTMNGDVILRKLEKK
jgi:hypothetical protein